MIQSAVVSFKYLESFGVPYSYVQHTCRVHREDFTLYIYDMELRRVLITHDVAWNLKKERNTTEFCFCRVCI